MAKIPDQSVSANWHQPQTLVRLISVAPNILVGKAKFCAARFSMGIDKDNIKTQDETGELAPIDQVEERVEAEMKKLEGEAKKFVADGMQNSKLAEEGERMVKEAERKLNDKEDAD